MFLLKEKRNEKVSYQTSYPVATLEKSLAMRVLREANS
jgi:hypothetical protein